MNIDLPSISDPLRLAALHETLLMDTPAEESFDRITRLAASLLAAPVALISLVDSDHQFFKSCAGLPEPWCTVRQTPLTHSFCKYVVDSNSMLIVNDAREEPFLLNNLAVRDINVIAYVGAPLQTSRGQTIGAFCVIDTVPRQWTAENAKTLTDLAAFVMSEIERRRLENAEHVAERSLKQTLGLVEASHAQLGFEKQIHFLADAMPQMVWTAAPDGRIRYYNRRWFDYTGLNFEQTSDWGWQQVVHPDDLQPCLDSWNQSLVAGTANEDQTRFKRASDGEYRWHLLRTVPMRDESGTIIQWVGTGTDIHDSKQMATALKESHDELEARVEQRTTQLLREHRFLEAVLDNIVDGIVACDETGTITLFNRASRELHGVTERAISQGRWAKTHALYAADGTTLMAKHQVPLFRAFQGEVVKEQEMCAAVTGGGMRRLLASGQAIFDSDGKKIGAVVGMHDITERAAAEAKFRVLFDCSSDAHMLVDETRGLIDCNPAAAAMLGCSDVDQLLAIHPARFSPEYQPDGRKSAEKAREMDEIARAGQHRFDWTLRRLDGTDLQVEVTLTPVQLSGKNILLSVIHDLTERKKAEDQLRLAYTSMSDAHAALRQSEERFATFMDYSPSVSFIKDEQSRLLYVNQQFENIHGKKSLELLGKNDFEYLPKQTAKENTVGDQIVLRTNNPVETPALAPFPTGDAGSWMMLRFPLRASDGRTLIGGVAFDVTASEKAKEAADLANRAKTDFLANMSHEIRTPMTSILGYTELLDDPFLTAQQRAEHVKVIRRNGKHLMDVLNDILDISKIEAGEMTVEQLPCSPLHILSEVESLMRQRAHDKNITFGIESCGQIPAALITDPLRLKQILINLIGNAIKFTTAGSVKVLLQVKEKNSIRHLRFDVTDTGIGISPEQMANLFHPFRQADGSTTRRFGGSGLGLAISKRLVAAMGGELQVHSIPGHGSTFSLSIPVEESDAPVMACPSDHAPVRRVTGRVLLAEDGLDNRRLSTIYLESAGLTVETAINGRIAVDKVVEASQLSRPFDAVLMDMQMPELDGYAATAELRRLGFSQLRIIAFTAHALSGERDTCLKCGCDDYIPKPFDRATLLDVVSRNIARDSAVAARSALPETNVDEALMKLILEDYITGLPAHIAEIARHLSSGDLASLGRKVHQLKGSGGSYGFPQITQLAGEAEASIACQESMAQIHTQIDQLLQLVRGVQGYDRSREASPTL